MMAFRKLVFLVCFVAAANTAEASNPNDNLRSDNGPFSKGPWEGECIPDIKMRPQTDGRNIYHRHRHRRHGHPYHPHQRSLTSEFTIAENMQRLRMLHYDDLMSSLWEHEAGEVLLATLNEPDRNFTLFHPSSRAIKDFLRHAHMSGKPLSVEYLKSIVHYHLLNETIFVDDLKPQQFVPTLMWNPAFVHLEENQTQLLGITKKDTPDLPLVQLSFGVPKWPKYSANVIVADIICKNGVIHVIDRVMKPPHFALQTAEDSWLHAFVSATLSAEMGYIVDGAANVTVFVPQNQALEAVLGSGQIEPDDVRVLLMGHIAHGHLCSPELTDQQNIKMMNGDTVSVVIAESGTVTIGGARVLKADILTRNGVMHVLEGVVIPNIEVPKSDPM